MSTETEDDVTKPEAMFTRAQMAREVNRQVKEKVAAALAEYGDLDDLKARAAEADKNKSQLDRIEAQFAEMTKRAEKAERETLVTRVADKLGIPERLVRKLDGKTEAEMISEGRELIDDLGIAPKGKKTGGESAEGDDDAGNGRGADQDDQQQEQESEPTPREPATRRATRPREQLQSGAPRTPTQPEETDPMKLAALIPRR